MSPEELKGIRKLLLFARKIGAKKFSCSGVEIEFHDTAIVDRFERIATKLKSAPESKADKDTRPSPPPEPTLEDINRYIYENTDEAH